jgi:hypothetical protein
VSGRRRMRARASILCLLSRLRIVRGRIGGAVMRGHRRGRLGMLRRIGIQGGLGRLGRLIGRGCLLLKSCRCERRGAFRGRLGVEIRRGMRLAASMLAVS